MDRIYVMEWRGKVWVGRELFSVLSYFDIGVGDLRGSAEIRRLHISWGAITIQAASAYIERGLGFLALRRCANLGVIRMESVAAIRTLISAVFIFWILLALGSGSQSWFLWSGWFFLNLFLFSNLSQLCLFVVLGGNYWGSYWETGGIRGALTILAASAFVVWGIGFCVLWDSVNLGVIRKGAASVLGHFSPLLLFFCIFLVPFRGSQSWFLWFLWMEGCWLNLWVGMNSYSWAWFGLGISGMEWIILAGGNLVDYDMCADKGKFEYWEGRWLDGITGINKELGYVDKGWMGRGSLHEAWNKFVLLVDAKKTRGKWNWLYDGGSDICSRAAWAGMFGGSLVIGLLMFQVDCWAGKLSMGLRDIWYGVWGMMIWNWVKTNIYGAGYHERFKRKGYCFEDCWFEGFFLKREKSLVVVLFDCLGFFGIVFLFLVLRIVLWFV
ncbi:hypothetical protein HanPI659440_Chr15g0579891 [Helianthus annuus]|nr:hypothetical protein HanPI659440_Chr15g0579891 [Helianthus annuus]